MGNEQIHIQTPQEQLPPSFRDAKSCLEKAAKEVRSGSDTLSMATLELELFLECFEAAKGETFSGTATMEDLQNADPHLFLALKQVYTENVLEQFLYPTDKEKDLGNIHH